MIMSFGQLKEIKFHLGELISLSADQVETVLS